MTVEEALGRHNGKTAHFEDFDFINCDGCALDAEVRSLRRQLELKEYLIKYGRGMADAE